MIAHSFTVCPLSSVCGKSDKKLAILTHIFRELDIVSTQAEDQVRCVAQVDAVFYGLEKEWKSLQVNINSLTALIKGENQKPKDILIYEFRQG